MLRGKVSDLLAGRTVERLHPQIIDSGIAHRINDGLAIVCEVQRAAARALEVHAFYGLIGIDGNQNQLLDVRAEMAVAGDGG